MIACSHKFQRLQYREYILQRLWAFVLQNAFAPKIAVLSGEFVREPLMNFLRERRMKRGEDALHFFKQHRMRLLSQRPPVLGLKIEHARQNVHQTAPRFAVCASGRREIENQMIPLLFNRTRAEDEAQVAFQFWRDVTKTAAFGKLAGFERARAEILEKGAHGRI